MERIGLADTDDHLRRQCELLCTTDIGDYFSSAVIFEETSFQNVADGIKFVDILKSKRKLSGIKRETLG